MSRGRREELKALVDFAVRCSVHGSGTARTCEEPPRSEQPGDWMPQCTVKGKGLRALPREER